MLAEHTERDLLLTAEDFSNVRDMIHRRAGIALAPHKSEMVYSRLAKRLRQLGQTCFKDYLAQLKASASDPEWEHFTNALTTNLTAFFREAHHFPLLANHARERRVPLRVWCCAASTGEEAYSIAIALAEVETAPASGPTVIATDIDTRAIAVAREGIYSISDAEKISPERLKRFFLRGQGRREGRIRVASELREKIEFRALNLLDSDWSLGGGFDVIFCRNLMIYFDKSTQARLLARFAGLIKPGGLLFAGHSENFGGLTKDFRLRSHTVYERLGGPAGAA